MTLRDQLDPPQEPDNDVSAQPTVPPTPDSSPDPEAISPGQRIVALDAVRGFALLGIIFVNVWYFGMPSVASIVPTAYGDLSGWNLVAWWITHVFFEEKFITLFALMFGVGVVLFTERLSSRGETSIRLHYRRMLWMLIFGLFHAYLLWYGDILVLYALCGMLLFVVRKWRARTLIILGLVPIVVGSLLMLMVGGFIAMESEDVREEMGEDWVSQEEAQRELDAYRGSWSDQMTQRVDDAAMMHLFVMPFLLVWHPLGVMMLGIALYRLGLFSRASRKALTWFTGVGLAVGLPLVVIGAQLNLAAGFRWDFTFFFGDQFNYWGSLFLAGGYLGALLFIAQSALMQGMVRALSAVGRMAFTNYILQSLIATTIFYGHGLGWFGSIERVGLFGIALAIAAIQVPLSVFWLRHFRYGPLEWLWRSLTYRKPARMRSTTTSAEVGPVQS